MVNYLTTELFNNWRRQASGYFFCYFILNPITSLKNSEIYLTSGTSGLVEFLIVRFTKKPTKSIIVKNIKYIRPW